MWFGVSLARSWAGSMFIRHLGADGCNSSSVLDSFSP